MSTPPVERLILGAKTDFPRAQLAQAVSPDEHTVAELLPAGFTRYLRVFHPFLPADPNDPDKSLPGPVRSWASLAEEARAVFHPEIMSWALMDVLGGTDGPRPFWVSEGRLDEPARSALFALLAEQGEQDAYFLYDLAPQVRGGSPLLYRASVSRYAEVQEAANLDLGDEDESAPGPEFVWPADQSWFVNTDYDLDSTYVACDDVLAEAILAEPTLESLPVSRDTRVDSAADRINIR
jgi:hypothetical protein